jgi:hypothetical protein
MKQAKPAGCQLLEISGASFEMLMYLRVSRYLKLLVESDILTVACIKQAM